jgi:putative ABC transport system ATP-binding protein
MKATTSTAPEAATPGVDTTIIRLAGVEKEYRTGKLSYRALRGVDLAIEPGEMVAIVGPSGSGKTTILNIASGIDRPTAGTVTVTGRRIDSLDEEELATWRGRHIGIVFQFFQLLPTLTAIENVELPMDFAHIGKPRERAARALHNLELVGLADKANHLPVELSGGEQQRVAIARALSSDPPILMGDELTGNLDSDTAEEMFNLLTRLNAAGTTIVYVTHDTGLAARSPRKVTIRDGLVVGDSRTGT